ncbi:ABC transporter permease [Ancylobacter terrae]|uniref:ABC transporter permease n=1 Tax=Ancylobacter sp. sgz301288 TaxID=3342077 RepID=UPI00385C0345
MLRYILRRIAIMVPTLLVTSALIFTVMQLPPSDYFETYVAEMAAQGEKADMSRVEFLKKEYGFDKPVIERYWLWVSGFVRGDFGYSFEYEMPVNEVVGERLGLTVLVSFTTIIVTWLVAFPIGIYCATHQYSWGDYGLTFIGLIGIAIPHFLLALVMMYFANVWFGLSIGGLMDPVYFNQPMSWAKAQSILAHLWIPVLIIGAGGTGSMVRSIRANLLDELRRQYYVTAKAKGLPPGKALRKYPLRMSLNFFVSHIGDVLPSIVSGSELTAVVLSLQTTGPLLLRALQSQDMYLAGSFLLFLSCLTVIGVLLSDIALGFLDPRIRLQGGSTK